MYLSTEKYSPINQNVNNYPIHKHDYLLLFINISKRHDGHRERVTTMMNFEIRLSETDSNGCGDDSHTPWGQTREAKHGL